MKVFFAALELIQNTEKKFNSERIKLDVEPTYFYKNKNDVLQELIDIFITSNSGDKKEVSLKIDDQRFDTTLSGSQNFGEQMVEFEVPEFSSKKNVPLR